MGVISESAWQRTERQWNTPQAAHRFPQQLPLDCIDWRIMELSREDLSIWKIRQQFTKVKNDAKAWIPTQEGFLRMCRVWATVWKAHEGRRCELLISSMRWGSRDGQVEKKKGKTVSYLLGHLFILRRVAPIVDFAIGVVFFGGRCIFRDERFLSREHA